MGSPAETGRAGSTSGWRDGRSAASTQSSPCPARSPATWSGVACLPRACTWSPTPRRRTTCLRCRATRHARGSRSPTDDSTSDGWGEGRQRPQLQQSAASLGLGDRVRWLGNVAEAGRLFAGFDVFALSSRTEGTPIVLFEAMAARTPIVASAVGGVPDVVSPREALL